MIHVFARVTVDPTLPLMVHRVGHVPLAIWGLLAAAIVAACFLAAVSVIGILVWFLSVARRRAATGAQARRADAYRSDRSHALS